MTVNKDDLLVSELAELIGVPESTIKYWNKEYELRAYKDSRRGWLRFKPESVEAAKLVQTMRAAQRDGELIRQAVLEVVKDLPVTAQLISDADESETQLALLQETRWSEFLQTQQETAQGITSQVTGKIDEMTQHLQENLHHQDEKLDAVQAELERTKTLLASLQESNEKLAQTNTKLASSHDELLAGMKELLEGQKASWLKRMFSRP